MVEEDQTTKNKKNCRLQKFPPSFLLTLLIFLTRKEERLVHSDNIFCPFSPRGSAGEWFTCSGVEEEALGLVSAGMFHCRLQTFRFDFGSVPSSGEDDAPLAPPQGTKIFRRRAVLAKTGSGARLSWLRRAPRPILAG